MKICLESSGERSMNELESDFLEQYKRVDRICKDKLSSEKGLSQYIQELQENGRYNKECRALLHLRSIRNRIVHESGNSGCSENDLKILDDFYCDLISMQDSLTEIYGQKRKSENDGKTQSFSGNYQTKGKGAQDDESANHISKPLYLEPAPHYMRDPVKASFNKAESRKRSEKSHLSFVDILLSLLKIICFLLLLACFAYVFLKWRYLSMFI